MIRRIQPLGDQPRKWLLISQIEHARLSQVLAEHWGSDDLPAIICCPDEVDPAKLQIRREVLAGIARHDDGWASWEAAPAIDPAHGRPFDFMEMPQADSLAIWRQSIRAARTEGPLAGAMAAGHFLALLANSHRDLSPAAIEWRSDVESRCSEWLRAWHEVNPDCHSREIADQALQWLQVFDWLSLFLCCKCPALPVDSPDSAPPLELHAPNRASEPIVFSFDRRGAELLVEAAPWPFSTRELVVAVACDVVPIAEYHSTVELMDCRRPSQLRWRLRAQ